MNKITTTNVVDPTIQQPFTTGSLNFLQSATTNTVIGLAQSLIGSGYTSAIPYVLTGLESYGTNQYYPGYIFWDNEVYYSPGKTTTTSFSASPVCVLSDTADSFADPVQFTNGAYYDVHRNRTIAIDDLIAGTGNFDLSDLTYVQSLSLDYMANRGFVQATNVQYTSGGTSSKIIYITENIDDNNWYTGTTSRYLPQRAGYYRVTANILISANSSFSPPGYPYTMVIRKNGSTVQTISATMLVGSDVASGLGGSGLVYCNGTTDYLEVWMETGTSGPDYTFSRGSVQYVLEAI